MKILEEFYYGNIDPHERFFKKDGEYAELVSISTKNEQDLVSTMTEKQKETFEKYMAVQSEMSDVSERKIFINGFKLGLRFMAEAYTAIEDLE